MVRKQDKDKLQYDGIVLTLLPSASFMVKLDNGHEIVAHTSGRMRKARVKVLIGDRVTVEMTPYDNTKGRVVHRHKKNMGQ